MLVYELAQVNPGMIIAKDVVTPKGQLIVPRGSRLSQQMISHMRFYHIETVTILPNEVSPVDPLKEEDDTSYILDLRLGEDFNLFKEEHSQSVNLFRAHMQAFLENNQPLNTDVILQDTLRLFHNNRTTFSMLDMLHSMHNLNDSTYVHSINVSVISRLIGIWSGISGDELDLLTLCGLLHDVGKAKIPEEILNKPSALSDEEYAIMKSHSKHGYDILKPQNLDPLIAKCALLHHERYDGKGYPLGISGADIPDLCSIISIADVYEALTSDRCYRDALCPFEVIAIMERNGLKEFHPKYILTFLQNIAHTYLQHKAKLSDGSTGTIIFINKQITRPMMQMDTGELINLEERLDLYVEQIY